jgi:hypothetical protein
VKGKQARDAVRRSGQWLHGGQGLGGAERWRKADGGGACSVQHREEEESQVGRVGQKAEQAGGRLGQLGQKLKEIPF